ncbi:MAG: selenide, water dikinase SelD [Spirochaetales bacterium]|nr:selenide, water dikinase SelD [Spirochaetales bacterium]
MSEKFDLLTTVEYGGCSAKLPPGDLEELLKNIPILEDKNLLVGNDTHDDGSVYKISEDTAIITTTDFFPPICSDPYDFGQVAAANSLSDIYAMGGKAVTALNLVMFPSTKLDLGILKDIIRGGADKCIEADTVLAGGHTIDDYPPKYGLAVTGTVHPQKIITNDAARPGEVLILTKPLGTGVIIAGQRMNETTPEDYQGAIDSMKCLNKQAAVVMQKYGVRCATDITGFSLLGHGMKLGRASGVQLNIDSTKIPALSGALDLLELGCIPGASFRNLKYTESSVYFGDSLDYNLKMLCADAQTSGGILMCAPADKADEMVKELKEFYPWAEVIGEIVETDDGVAVEMR